MGPGRMCKAVRRARKGERGLVRAQGADGASLLSELMVPRLALDLSAATARRLDAWVWSGVTCAPLWAMSSHVAQSSKVFIECWELSTGVSRARMREREKERERKRERERREERDFIRNQ